MRAIDADTLMPSFIKKANTMKDRHGVKLGEEWLLNYNDIKDVIDNAPTVEDVKEPFITECRNTAIEKNLPLYFIYYEETGVFEVYVTKTKELFEKRHCIKHLPEYRFKEFAMQYLDDYSDWEVVRNEIN